MFHRKILSAVLLTCVIAIAVCSSYSHAGLITDYSLDSDTRIVTDSGNNLEWLQWSVTRGQSLDDALRDYASEGWVLASGAQMVELFNTFELSYDNFVWQDGVSNRFDSPQDVDIESADDRELIFVSLFGDTIGRLGWQYSGALFGFGSNDNTFHWAQVSDDWGYSFPGDAPSPYQEGENRIEFNYSNVGFFRSQLGVALVRPADSSAVPEPSAIALISLALVGMALRRRKIK